MKSTRKRFAFSTCLSIIAAKWQPDPKEKAFNVPERSYNCLLFPVDSLAWSLPCLRAMTEPAANREQNIVRGYDTQGLFWQDVLIRTRQANFKPEVARVHVEVSGLLVEMARQQGWHSQS